MRFLVSRGPAGVPNIKISAITTSGRIFPDTVTADSSGIARLTLLPADPRAAAVVSVRARTQLAGSAAVTNVSIATAAPAVYKLVDYANNYVGVLEKSQLTNPIWLEVRRMRSLADTASSTITDVSECNAQRVVFRNLSAVGSLPTDTMRGEVSESERSDEEGDPKCFVWTTWSVGDGPGRRQARAVLLSPPAAVHQYLIQPLEVTARSLPRLIAGPALTWGSRYFAAVKPSGTPIRVERVLPDGRKIVYDSLPAGARVDTLSRGGEPQVTAMVGASITPFPRYHPATVLVGMNLASPTDDFFFGTSLVRLIPGTESWPVDVNLLGRVGKRRELVSREACELDAAQCQTQRRTAWRYGLTFTFDASTLVSEAVKKLAGG